MNSSNAMVIQMHQIKLSRPYNKALSHEHRKGTSREEEGVFIGIGGRLAKVGEGCNKNALCTCMKPLKNQFNNNNNKREIVKSTLQMVDYKLSDSEMT